MNPQMADNTQKKKQRSVTTQYRTSEKSEQCKNQDLPVQWFSSFIARIYDGLMNSFETVYIEKLLVASSRVKSLSTVEQYAA
jgi:hypothetical protein